MNDVSLQILATSCSCRRCILSLGSVHSFHENSSIRPLLVLQIKQQKRLSTGDTVYEWWLVAAVFIHNKWISKWPPLSTCHCPAWLQPIWPPTVSLSPTTVVVSCVLSHQGRVLSVLSDEPTATLETDVLQLQVRSCRTAFQLIYNNLTLAFSD